MKITLMTDRFGYQKAIEEQRDEWIENLLLFLGIDIQLLLNKDKSLFVLHLFQNKIEILEDLRNGFVQIKSESEVVGIWDSPKLTLKTDNGGFYYEIELNYWSILEENINV
jgi:hypothetical protein